MQSKLRLYLGRRVSDLTRKETYTEKTYAKSSTIAHRLCKRRKRIHLATSLAFLSQKVKIKSIDK